jgi:amidophosphoribosyltransferase
VDAMKKAVGVLNTGIKGFDASCFDGIYVTGDITADDILRLNSSRVVAEDPAEEASAA